MTRSIDGLNKLKFRWRRLLSRPDWYLSVIPELQSWSRHVDREACPLRERAKALLYDFFESQLQRGNIALGSGDGYFDTERRPVDTVVVHHTSNPPGMSPMRLSAIELVRLYAPYFIEPSEEDDRLRGSPVFSGHVRDGNQVFWPYHWIVRNNGRAERLLDDDEVGWHAGNWDVNCRSVAIVLDGDYEQNRPSEIELGSIANVVAEHYGSVPMNRIIGHREVTGRTTCPSEVFLRGPNFRGWKYDLLTMLRRRAS